jgi:hypothetical protein
MSLEQALAENTAALQALTEAWSKLTVQADTIQNMPEGTVVHAAGKPVNAAPKSSKGAATPTATGTAAVKAEPAAESPSDPKPQSSTGSSEKPSASVDYATLQKAVFALANKSRDAAGAVAKALGVANFKGFEQATGEERAAALAAVNAKLEELEVA